LASKEEKARRDTHWGTDGLQRLDRLARLEKRSGAEIARQALIDYELGKSYFRDTVREAVLGVLRALLPDEQFDPVDDIRQDEAVGVLGMLLNSVYAAQGIRDALEAVVVRNQLLSLEVPAAQSSDPYEVDQQQGSEQRQVQDA
jgi:hypothetical protein